MMTSSIPVSFKKRMQGIGDTYYNRCCRGERVLFITSSDHLLLGGCAQPSLDAGLALMDLLLHDINRQMQMQEDGRMIGGGFNLSGEAPFEIRGFSLANLALLIGVGITGASFFEYFTSGGSAGLSGVGFVYGIPISLIGLALKVCCRHHSLYIACCRVRVHSLYIVCFRHYSLYIAPPRTTVHPDTQFLYLNFKTDWQPNTGQGCSSSTGSLGIGREYSFLSYYYILGSISYSSVSTLLYYFAPMFHFVAHISSEIELVTNHPTVSGCY